MQIARWETKDNLEIIHHLPVVIILAANAAGYQVLPPCVAYDEKDFDDGSAGGGGDGEEEEKEKASIPDFFGLPEVGFVKSTGGKVTAEIFVRYN